MNYTYLRFAFIAGLLAGIVFTSACKREGKSIGEWEDLAQTTMAKIEKLSGQIPCEKFAETKVKTVTIGCGKSFFPYTSETEAELNSLLEDYLYYSGRIQEARIKEGVIYEPCPSVPMADYIRLDCQDNFVMVITAENLPLAEAQPFIDDAYYRLLEYKAGLTCDALTRLTYLRLLKKEGNAYDVEYLILDRIDIPEGIGKDVALYNQLRQRQLEELSDTPTYIQPQEIVEGIGCEDGKPVLQFKPIS